jgi:uncharacterized protein involved in outer membrane biogenesis
MPARLLKILLSLPFMIAAGLFGFYLVFGFFLVDPLARKILPWVGEEKLASQLSVQKVEFNPLTLEATVHGLKLTEKNGQPLAGFERLYVNLETLGLFRFAWHMKDVELTGPYADFVVRKGGKLNWAELIAKLNEDKEPPKDTMPRVLIDRINIEKGNLEYIDANRAGDPFRVQLQPLGVKLAGLSTLPEDRGNYLIAARLTEQGGTLKWKGDVSLNPVKSDGEVALEGAKLANLPKVIKTPLNFELPSGTLAAGTRYRFAMVKDKSGQDKPWVQINGANLVLQNLALAPRGGGAPVFELAEARVSNANLDLYARKLDVAEVSLKAGKLAATRDIDGTLDWQKLFAAAGDVPPPAAKPQAKPEARAGAEAGAPWKLAVRSIRMEDWSARYVDNGYVQPVRLEAAGFGLAAALTGEVGSATAIRVGPVNASLGPVRAFSGAENVAEIGNIRLSNANYDVAANDLGIEALELSGLKTAVALGKDKQLNWGRIMARHEKTTKGYAVAAVTEKQAMKVKLGHLALTGMQVAVSDQSTPKPVLLDIVNGHARFNDLSLDYDKPVTLEAGLDVRQGGRLSVSGSLVPGRPSGKLNLKLAGLSLKPFAPYVSQFARLDLQSGAASTSGKLSFAKGGKDMKLNYDGGFSVDDLAIIEEDTAEAFLGWGKLSSDTLQLSLGPNRLHMSELAAARPFGKVIIFEDKSINLKRILRSQSEPAAQAQGATVEAKSGEDKPEAPQGAEVKAAENKPAATESDNGFPIAIERLRIDNANAEFADLSLPTQFGTRMHSLSGVITGLSTDPATTAQVELDGSVDDYGSARVRGSIQPFRATDFTDIRLTFRNLEMTRLTPYSGKFAGRKIDSGRLSVDLEYKIKQRQLAGENKFVINKLKLGERVDSPDALKLPLDLAIALLQDSNGVIDIDLPISGSLDDPKFSYGRIIWKAIVNVLTKLVTAPFRALGSLLGISSEKLEAVEFDPGSSALLPPEQEKLKSITEALAKRPALTLSLEPSYDPEADRRALQELAMRREAAAVAGVKLAPNEAPGPVDVNNYKIQTWLEDRYAEIAGKAEYQKLRAGYKGKDAGVMDSELVERIGRRFKTRDTGPVSALHTELLERLTRQTKIDDAALLKLAQARGQAMHDALLKQGLEGSRVSVAAPGQQTAKGKLVPSKMSLGASRHAAVAPPPAAVPAPAAP